MPPVPFTPPLIPASGWIELGLPVPHDLKKASYVYARSQAVSGCWIWQGSLTPTGYSRCHYEGKMTYGHRLAHEAWTAPISGEIDHVAARGCHSRSCVNPLHLEDVDHRTNLLRSPNTFSGAAAAKTHCDHGHPLSGDNLKTDNDGHRKCGTCYRAWVVRASALHKAQRAAARAERGPTTACCHGHPHTPENGFRTATGGWRCTLCRQARNQRYNEKRRATRSGELSAGSSLLQAGSSLLQAGSGQ